MSLTAAYFNQGNTDPTGPPPTDLFAPGPPTPPTPSINLAASIRGFGSSGVPATPAQAAAHEVAALRTGEAHTRTSGIEQRERAADEREADLLAREVEMAERQAQNVVRKLDQQDGALTLQAIRETEDEMVERERNVSQRESDAARREAQLEALTEEMMRQKDILKSKYRQLQSEDRELEERQQRVIQLEEKMRIAEQRATERHVSFVEKEGDLTAFEHRIKAEVEAKMQKLADRESSVALQEERLNQTRHRIAEMQEDLSQREAHILRDNNKIIARSDEVESLEQTTAQRLAILNTREDAILQREQQLREREQQGAEKSQADTEHSQRAAERLDEWATKMKRREAQNEEIDANLEMKMRVSREKDKELQRREDRVRRAEEELADAGYSLAKKHEVANTALNGLEEVRDSEQHAYERLGHLRERTAAVALRERFVSEREHHERSPTAPPHHSPADEDYFRAKPARSAIGVRAPRIPASPLSGTMKQERRYSPPRRRDEREVKTDPMADSLASIRARLAAVSR